MAGQIKRLRRKTTVSQSACSELLLLTSEWWMQFVLPLGRYEPRVYAIFWMKKWRLLCKAWREVWDQGFRVKLSLDQSHVLELCSVAFHSGVLGDLLFCRDRANKIIYYHEGYVHGRHSSNHGRFCFRWLGLEIHSFLDQPLAKRSNQGRNYE